MATTVTYKPVEPCDAQVLVVEDNTDNFITIARLLAYSGIAPFRSHWKASGLGAVQHADLLPHLDLILLDIGLPHEDGYEILAKIRTMARFNSTLVVAVSGRVDEMEKARAAGFDGFVGKPLEPDRFPGQLSRILKGEPVWECK
jgi:two-component system cell cycle response regulator DivK